MNKIYGLIAASDEETLISLANKGIYKRACKDIEGITPEICEKENSIEVKIGDEVCTINSPLSESRCSCVSRGICRHIMGAILLLKKDLPEGTVAEAPVSALPTAEKKAIKKDKKKEVKKDITETEADRIRDCAKMCLKLLCDVLKYGLVRVPDNVPEDFELAAVRCHKYKMADGERIMRDLGGRLDDCIKRRASFSVDDFAKRFCDCAMLMKKLTEANITAESLGNFKDKYTDHNGELEILPISRRTVKWSGYEGEIYYFLNTDEKAEKRFLSFSDIRPTFYESTAQRRMPQASPWGLGVPIGMMIKTRMTLANAKISGGKLSSSGETEVIKQVKAVINCPEMQNLTITDFRQAVIELAEKNIESELDRLYLLHIERCVSSEFDKYSQMYIIVVEDSFGNRAEINAKYSSEKRDFIRMLERIGKKMMTEPKNNYAMLVAASIENGKLTLFPYDFYDNIEPAANEEYTLQNKYKDMLGGAAYINTLTEFLENVRDKICTLVQCGLCSGLKDGGIVKQAERLGMSGLAEMTDDFIKSAELYRHRRDENSLEILEKMLKLNTYLKTAERKTGVISALKNMTEKK